MNINEVEKRVQISKQNIRFYEKKGLIKPKRKEDNQYRDYTEEDIHTLECIKILRLLDVPVEEIKELIKKDQLSSMMEKHKALLEKQVQDLKGAIAICDLLTHENSLKSLDTKRVLLTIQALENDGNSFAQFKQDYKELAYLEAKKKFSFMPDNACMNKDEFREALLQFAKEQGKEILITKETMYPEFELDGVEYKAERQFGRYGAVVNCEAKYPELLDAAHVLKRNKFLFKLFHHILPYVLLFIFIMGINLAQDGPFYYNLLFGLGEIALVIAMGRLYYHNVHE